MNNSQCIVYLSVLLVAGISADVAPNNEVEKQILEFFERWRDGDSSPFALPPLDLIYIPATNGSYSGKGIKITYATSEVLLRGVNNFTVEALNVSLPFLFASGSLKIPAIVLNADQYTIQGKAFYVYTLKGSGRLNATIHDVNLDFGIRLGNVDNRLKVIEMRFDFKIASIEANLENSSWPINKLLNYEGVDILNRYHDDIVSSTQANIVEHVDDYLGTMSLVDLLNQIRQVQNS